MTSREEQLTRSSEGLMEMLTHHIVYEIEMMRHTYICLTGPAHVWFSHVVINALKESFCVHARNLIEFFQSKEKPKPDTARASDFTKNEYKRLPDDPPIKLMMEKLHRQIAHPSYSRTKRDDEKIGDADREYLMHLVDDEVARFEQHLTPEYTAKWPALADQSVAEKRPSGGGTATFMRVRNL